jgi:integrase
LTYEQLAAFLDTVHALSSHRDATLFLVLADAGLRPGEALALRWEDFDAAARSLRIARAVSSGRVKGTKSEGTRWVDVTPRLTSALGGWQSATEADSLLAGRSVSQWIFPSDAGTPIDEQRVAKRFREILRRAGLPRFWLYDLRHTFATHLLSEGAPIIYVAAQLGHAKPTTTLLHYAHWLPRGDKAYIDRLAHVRSTATPTLNDESWHRFGTKSEIGDSDAPEVPDSLGGPSRTRTLDPLIKSQLLYQLS